MTRVLVIDDDDNVRAAMTLTLSEAGYQVLAAADGREGMAIHGETPADVVITDIFMPEQEGVETIIQLRRDFPQTMIIAISGGGRRVYLDCLSRAGKLGAHRTLSKPFSRTELLDALRDVLEQADAADRSRQHHPNAGQSQ